MLLDGHSAASVAQRREISSPSHVLGTDALGIPIQPGFYPQVRHADFAPPGFAGVDISFQNRGCNMLTGSMTIEYVSFDASLTTIQSFRAMFEQHFDGMAPTLTGKCTYDVVPEPISLGLITIGGAIWGEFRSRRSKLQN
jgi:hypothetical protein